MSFVTRIEKSHKAIHRFDSWCELKGIIYAKSGYEDLISNNGELFRSKIQQLDEETARRIRYFPDRIVLLKNANLVEVKNGKTIERDAYNTYIDLHEIGYRVGIVFLNNYVLIFVSITELKFQIPQKGCLPIIDIYWLAPRELNKHDYYLWKEQHPNASGTTFGIIDFKETIWTVLS